jgi:flagellar biosynthesis protein FlhF
MNIKRFVAADMREALRSIRENLGADAVMLSSRTIAEGVEVIAAIDYDDSLFTPAEEKPARAVPRTDTYSAEALRDEQRAAPSPAPPPPRLPEPETSEYQRIAASLAAPGVPRPTPTRAVRRAPAPPQVVSAAPRVAAAPPRQAPVQTPPAVAAELKDLRRLLEGQLASLAWNDVNRRDPTRARVLRQFAQLGIDPAIARDLIARLPKSASPRDAWRLPLRLLAESLRLANRELTDIGGTFAVIGPTGVGKTTTIAKMAARFVLRHGVGGLGLVSTDSFRIGAREQLLTFARILGAPMQVAASAQDLRQVLDGLRDKKLVLIDTAGMSQRDVRLANQFATLKVRGHQVRPVLALSAASDRGCLADALKVFQATGPQALIFTKVDEATTLGPMLSIALQAKLPIAYISDGQRVPEDLHLAGRKRSWVIQTALRLAHDYALKPDEAELAEQFTRIGRVANA